MITLSFNDFAERYCSQLQAVFYFTASDADTPRIPVGERMEILLRPWQMAVDAISERLLAWIDRNALADKANLRLRYLHLRPEAEKCLSLARIEACLVALVCDSIHPDREKRAADLLADLTADLLC